MLEDEVVSHAFSHGYHPDHTERLAAYWAEALGGPTTYSDQYGDETSVVRIHSGNGLHEEMDQRAIDCFDQALEDVGLARDERLRCCTITSRGLPRPRWLVLCAAALVQKTARLSVRLLTKCLSSVQFLTN